MIPQELRKRYGLRKGDKVHFVDYGGVVAIVPVSGNAVEEAAGIITGNKSLVEALLESRRQDAARRK